MKKIIVAYFVLLPFTILCQQQTSLNNRFVLVIHGGAGTILKSEMSAEKESTYRNALAIALQTGYDTLKKNQSVIFTLAVPAYSKVSFLRSSTSAPCNDILLNKLKSTCLIETLARRLRESFVVTSVTM